MIAFIKQKVFFIVLLSLAFGNLSAQRSEIGFGLGTFNYTGDIARTYNISHSKPAATVFYRSNLSKVISFRVAMTGGKIGAKDNRRPIDGFTAERNASFNIFLLEASTVMEYHFLNWRDEKRMLRFTPYLFAGLGLFGISGHQNKQESYSNVQATIPFGTGIKYIINPKWYIGLEIGARKTFFDYLDNISTADQRNKSNRQYGNPFTNDAYYFLGLSLTYAFYSIPCPTNPYK
jgi:hypothetical protein